MGGGGGPNDCKWPSIDNLPVKVFEEVAHLFERVGDKAGADDLDPML